MDLVAREILKDVTREEVGPKPRRLENPEDHWSPAVLLERAAYLRKLAKYGDGSASEMLKEYPQHCAMLSFRSRDGEAEVHEKFADLFCVLAGKATLVTGGVVAGARTVAPGETRGASIDGGAGAGSVEEVKRMVTPLRQRWPEVKIVLRADSGFCREELMAWSEQNHVDYAFGLAVNQRLRRIVGRELHQAHRLHQSTDKAARVFTEFRYPTRRSWSRARRVVAEAEYSTRTRTRASWSLR